MAVDLPLHRGRGPPQLGSDRPQRGPEAQQVSDHQPLRQGQVPPAPVGLGLLDGGLVRGVPTDPLASLPGHTQDPARGRVRDPLAHQVPVRRLPLSGPRPGPPGKQRLGMSSRGVHRRDPLGLLPAPDVLDATPAQGLPGRCPLWPQAQSGRRGPDRRPGLAQLDEAPLPPPVPRRAPHTRRLARRPDALAGIKSDPEALLDAGFPAKVMTPVTTTRSGIVPPGHERRRETQTLLRLWNTQPFIAQTDEAFTDPAAGGLLAHPSYPGGSLETTPLGQHREEPHTSRRIRGQPHRRTTLREGVASTDGIRGASCGTPSRAAAGGAALSRAVRQRSRLTPKARGELGGRESCRGGRTLLALTDASRPGRARWPG